MVVADNEHGTDARAGDMFLCPLIAARRGPEGAMQRSFEVFSTPDTGRGVRYVGQEPLPRGTNILPLYGIKKKWKQDYRETDRFKSYAVDFGKNAVNAFRDKRAVRCHPSGFLVNQANPGQQVNVQITFFKVYCEQIKGEKTSVCWRTLCRINSGEPILAQYGSQAHAYEERQFPTAWIPCSMCSRVLPRRKMGRHVTGHALHGQTVDA